ncbi:hypothetical protein SAMN04489757_10665 [Anaerocolumna aminovalerica]|uniref:Polysaccharide deacetylase n=1 Tax=Anaerocolumna aminovalerica TaxID=1527 RepID=A0A1I5DKS5_9FIRM|nr:hypothetical protein SAMN04489757_10665 [Anaerocolumna aminovalerica]
MHEGGNRVDNKTKGYTNKTNSYDYRAESNVKKTSKKGKYKTILVAELLLLFIAIAGILTFALAKGGYFKKNNNNQPQGGINAPGDKDKGLTPEEKEEKRLEEEKKAQQEKISKLVEEADLLAMGYDYDKAIETIKSYGEGYTNHTVLTDAIAKYEADKEKLVPLGAYESVNEISHVFFHSLVADNSKAFDGDYASNGYNYYMTTISEFKEMMKQMYEAGYVLVSIHDVARQVTAEDGTTKFVSGDIMLPPDKKPFVLSQDDVNYYEYMTGDGFASKAVIDENGRPSTAMIMDDGTVSVGDYDMVPVLETFIAEHPDFSYKGARGILALTGYEGTLGYRTNDKTSPTYEEDKETVKEVVKNLKEWGWEFASHSYGHRNMGKASYTFTVTDTDRWMEEVGSLIGPTDVYIFPYGIDIEESVSGYTSDKYNYLKSLGFNYYCGVFKSPWIQVKDEYVRMTRRPLDGQAMLQFPERLADLFDLSKVIDPDRPALK